jgi:hypothetical protein
MPPDRERWQTMGKMPAGRRGSRQLAMLYLMPRDVEAEIERLNRLREVPAAGAAAGLRKALDDRVNLIVAKGAKLAAELQQTELIPDLLRAFDRLCEKAVERDAQCWGKNAISKALASLGHRESAVFLRGVRHIQMEPTWGKLEDTAATLRGTCALALPACTDLERGRILRLLVDALADDASTVRSDVARALSQMEGDEAILLLRLKARLGDSEAEVIGQVFDYLLQLEGKEALGFVAEFLDSPETTVREEAALALGSSRLPGAVEVLSQAWLRHHDSDFRLVLLRALSATRQPSALEFLLKLVRLGREQEAVSAVTALALHRESADIRRQAEEAAARRESSIREHVRR